MKNLSNSIFLHCFLKEQKCQLQIWGDFTGNLNHETRSLFFSFALEISAVIQPELDTTFLSMAMTPCHQNPCPVHSNARWAVPPTPSHCHLGQVTMARGESQGLWGDRHNACPRCITTRKCCSENYGLAEKTQDFSTALQYSMSKKTHSFLPSIWERRAGNVALPRCCQLQLAMTCWSCTWWQR